MSFLQETAAHETPDDRAETGQRPAVSRSPAFGQLVHQSWDEVGGELFGPDLVLAVKDGVEGEESQGAVGLFHTRHELPIA